jgi:hypothetical protein
MRSGSESCPVLLTCAGAALILSACGSEAISYGSNDNRSQIGQLVGVAAAPSAAPAAASVHPVSDPLHFDLLCDLHGRVVSDPHPEEYHGTWPAGMRVCHHSAHFIIDLQNMQICDWSMCDRYGPGPIVGATPDRIVLHDEPGATIMIRRLDLHYQQRWEEFDRVSVTNGRCIKARFSGFPPRHASTSQ